METPRTFKIPAKNLAALQENIAKLAKRAEKVAKRGNLADATPIALTVGEKISEKVSEREDGCKVYFVCEVTGMTPKLAGWTFIATLQHEDGGTILRSAPTASFPEGTLNRFRTATSACEHCKYNRKRNDTFVVRNDDGRVMQVGRNCLADFTGVQSPEALAAMAELIASAGELCEMYEMYESGEGGRGEIVEDITAYLAYVAAAIRIHGWVSRTKARESYDMGGTALATADRAWTAMHPTPFTRKEDCSDITDADRLLAESAIAYTESSLTEALSSSLSDYEHNLRVACNGSVVTARLAGIVASIIGYYERAQSKIQQAKVAAEISARGATAGYVGEIKKKGTFRVSLVAVFSFSSTYGVTNVHKFATVEGNLLVWKTGTEKLALGEYVLTGTVKEHAVYKGRNGDELQTVVTRCKAELVKAAA